MRDEKGKKRYFLELDTNSHLHPVSVGMDTRMKALLGNKAAKKQVSEALAYNEDLATQADMRPVKYKSPAGEKDLLMQAQPANMKEWAYEDAKKQDEKWKTKDRLLSILEKAAPIALIAISFLIIYFAISSTGAACTTMAAKLAENINLASAIMGG